MSLSFISKNLRIFRGKRGYTQQHLANMLNTDCSTYSYYEFRKTTPDISSFIMSSQVFSTSLLGSLGQKGISPTLSDSSSGKSDSKCIADNDSYIHDLKKDELQLTVFSRARTVREKEELLRKAAEIQNKNERKGLD